MSTVDTGDRQPVAVLAYGFRPFFLLTALYAPLAAFAWVAVLFQLSTLTLAPNPIFWHAHEMLFGFATAALAGFILTALPSWTGTAATAGWPLALLVGLWLLGRVAMWFAAGLPPALVAIATLAFPATLLAFTLPGFRTAPGRRHLSLGVLLAAVVLGQLLFHLDGLLSLPWGLTAADAVTLTINAFLVMIAVTTSRIIRVVAPAALRESGSGGMFRPSPAREHLAVSTLCLFLLAELAVPGHAVTGWLALAAAAAQCDRLSEWPWNRAMIRPFLLFLAAAHLWLVIGLVLAGLGALMDSLPPHLGRHALSIGAIGTAILVVFCIAGLRHTGRPLVFPPATWTAFGLLTLAAALRTVVPPWFPAHYLTLGVALPTILWGLAFLVYAAAYGRFLLTRRPDG